jgi:hypothetical protein
VTDSPPASRLATPSWLDTRLVLGVLLVLVAVVVGARVLASADESQSVWATTRALAPGSTLDDDDLERVRVRLFDSEGGYVPAGAGDPAPTGYVLTRGLGGSELLPRGALRAPGELAELRDVSVPVEPGHLPGDLDTGELVDVYVTVKEPAPASPSAATPAGPTRLVLRDVPVKRRDSDDRGAADEAVVLSVPVADAGELVDAVRGGTVDLVRVPRGADLERLPSPGAPTPGASR